MLNRFNGHVVPFADNATATNRTVFGDVAQSDDIDDNLNADFKTGWEIVGINDNPTKQDFNGLGYTLGNLVSYLYQQGIAVWNTNQKYYVGSRCIGSDGLVYKALTGTEPSPNTGNNPVGDATNWKWDLKDFVDKTTAQTIAGIKTFSSFPVTPSAAPTADYQVANKKYVDDNSGLTAASTAEAQAGIIDTKGITPLKLHQSMLGGVTQAWTDVVGSRLINTNYTNTTGRPIEVSISFQTNFGGTISYLTIDGVNRQRFTHNDNTGSAFFTATIPNGSVYQLNSSTITVSSWHELR